MSRHIINDGMGALRESMDVMTIDASRLQIPAAGVRGKSRVRSGDIRLCTTFDPTQHTGRDQTVEHRSETQQETVTPMLSCVSTVGGKREDIVIDVRPRGDGKPGMEAQTLLESPAISVPVGYLCFWLAMALCNLLHPRLTHAVCTALSPLPMLCILAHAIGIHPAWVGWGLTLCGWLAPSVCALWSVQYSVGYLVFLVSLAVAGCRRLIPTLCLSVVVACGSLSLQPQWLGLEPKVWMTIAGFFTALACATAYVGGGKIVYRIKSVP